MLLVNIINYIKEKSSVDPVIDENRRLLAENKDISRLNSKLNNDLVMFEQEYKKLLDNTKKVAKYAKLNDTKSKLTNAQNKLLDGFITTSDYDEDEKEIIHKDAINAQKIIKKMSKKTIKPANDYVIYYLLRSVNCSGYDDGSEVFNWNLTNNISQYGEKQFEEHSKKYINGEIENNEFTYDVVLFEKIYLSYTYYEKLSFIILQFKYLSIETMVLLLEQFCE